MSKVSCVGTVFALLAFLALCYLWAGQPVTIPAGLSEGLPMTTLAFEVLFVISALMPVLFCCGSKKSSNALIMVAILLSIVAIFLAIEVLVYAGITVKLAVPYLWNGIPGVMEKKFADQCQTIPHKEMFGKVITEGCPHQCLVGIGQMAGLCVGAATQIAFGGVPLVTPPTPKYNGMTAPPGECETDADFDELAALVKNKDAIFSLLMICMISAIVLYVLSLICGLVTLCELKLSNAREGSKVEPLLSGEQEEETA